MNTQPPAQKSIFKNPYLYSGIILLAVVVYVSILLLSRYNSDLQYERRNAEKAAEDDRAAIEQLGGSELAIRAFYIAPSAIHRGQSAQLCYDVANAKSATLDPPAGEVWPSHNRCLNLSPNKTTAYTLTISDSSGKSASQTVELQVH
jgi:hypothetical protein